MIKKRCLDHESRGIDLRKENIEWLKSCFPEVHKFMGKSSNAKWSHEVSDSIKHQKHSEFHSNISVHLQVGLLKHSKTAAPKILPRNHTEQEACLLGGLDPYPSQLPFYWIDHYGRSRRSEILNVLKRIQHLMSSKMIHDYLTIECYWILSDIDIFQFCGQKYMAIYYIHSENNKNFVYIFRILWFTWFQRKQPSKDLEYCWFFEIEVNYDGLEVDHSPQITRNCHRHIGKENTCLHLSWSDKKC